MAAVAGFPSLSQLLAWPTEHLTEAAEHWEAVITMYPLEGASGVVKLGPKWTWTPPWVNNNVPIN